MHLNLRGTSVNYLITRLIKQCLRNNASEFVLFEMSACDKPRGWPKGLLKLRACLATIPTWLDGAFFLHLYTLSMLIHCQRDECFKMSALFSSSNVQLVFLFLGGDQVSKGFTKHSTCGSSFPCWFATLTAVLVQMCES